VSLALGKGDGTFQAPQSFQVVNLPSGIAVGDFNGDGAPDAVAANQLSYSVSVLLNTGGTNVSLASSPNPSNPGEPVTFTATVTPAIEGFGTPTGTVTLRSGSRSKQVPLVNGAATFAITFPAAGKFAFRAGYNGDNVYNRRISAPHLQKVK
jgi:Bacterial Ig-like domain (group 3)/FG-GAP-like repeat